ncbi:MAG: hypothetical protein IPH35_20015 [Rhodoferax sp.]|nr:hypothetical protein [Rhodoferax sp.]
MDEATARIAQQLANTTVSVLRCWTGCGRSTQKRWRATDSPTFVSLCPGLMEVLEHMLPCRKVSKGVHIFSPDPWHKTRHHKRRLIQPPIVHRVPPGSNRGATSVRDPLAALRHA